MNEIVYNFFIKQHFVQIGISDYKLTVRFKQEFYLEAFQSA